MKTQSISLFREKRPVIISGPCSAESEEQVLQTCEAIAKSGKVDILRAGIWKPRTRPNSFEGVGAIGIGWLAKARESTGLPIAVEVANTTHVEEALSHNVDILWVGARTTANPFSVQEIANALKGTNSTVLVKNPIHEDVELWTGALERLNQAGIEKLAMIHRGFAQHGNSVYRNEPKWQLAIEMKRRFSDIPLICDPSHICGKRDLIQGVAQQALDMDFDGLMIESHINPDAALSDKEQQVSPEDLQIILDSLIIRRSNITDVELTEKLQLLRNQIDLIDDDLVKLLGERMQVAEAIGLVKKEKGITILQAERWEEIIKRVTAQGSMHDLSLDFLERYLNAIHQESIEHQNDVMNTSELEEE